MRKPDTLGADAGAAVVVFLVALPLCLGIALASGAPLMSGIIAGVVGGLVVAPLSGSALMVSGPAAGLTAIVIAGLQDLGSFPPFLMAVALAGVLQVGLGAVRAGSIASYFPSAVIKGMLAAIGVILVLKQLPHAVGWDVDAMGDESFRQPDQENTFSELLQAARHVSPAAAVISALSLALLITWRRLPIGRLRAVPAALVVVLLAVAVNEALAALAPGLALDPGRLVSLPVASSPAGLLEFLTFPDWSAVTDPAVLRLAVTLALVASLESLLSLEATDRLDPLKRTSPPSRELVAQGVGNLLAGLLGGLPVTGVIVRSAANATAGARTRLSAILHGVLLLVAVMLVPAALNRIPLAVLAAVLIHTGLRLAHPALFGWMWRAGLDSFLPFVITVGAILLTDLLVGIGIGMAVGFAFILREHLRSPGYRVISPPGAVLTRLQLDDQVTFLTKAQLQRALLALPRGARVEVDGRASRRIDRDVRELLHDFVPEAERRGLDYRLVGVPLPLGGASPDH